MSSQTPETLQYQAVLTSQANRLLFTRHCFMNHVLLQDSTVGSFLPIPPSQPCFDASASARVIVTSERVTLTFSLLSCVLCLLLSSFTLAIKLYESRQELFTTSVRWQFDKAWVNTDQLKCPTQIGKRLLYRLQNGVFSVG